MALKDLFSPMGGLEKLKITAFTDDTYSVSTETYVVMYNPTTFSQFSNQNGFRNRLGRWLFQFRTIESDSVSDLLCSLASPPGRCTGDVNQITGANSINRHP